MLVARTLIDHFVVDMSSDRYSASAAAILTCCRPFFHSAITPRILAAEADNRWASLYSDLQFLLFTSETAQFSQALWVHERNGQELETLLSGSRYLSRSLLLLAVSGAPDGFWDLITKKVPCINLEEIDTDDPNIFRIFSDAASQGFKIHLKSLKLYSLQQHGAASLPGLLGSPEKLFSQKGTGWGKTLQVLNLNRVAISDQQFEAFQYCTNLREIDMNFTDGFTGKSLDTVFRQARFVSIVRLSVCAHLSDISGIQHLEYLNELSISECRLNEADNDDSTCGMSQWNAEGMFPYLEKFHFIENTAPDTETSLAFLAKAVPNLVDVNISSYETSIRNTVFGYLRGSASLRSIEITGTGDVTAEVVAGTLSTMKKLENLKIENALVASHMEIMFSESVIKALSPTLKVLKLSTPKALSIKKLALENLSKLELLEELQLHNASFDDDCCSSALLDLPKLRKFDATEAKNLTSINFLRPCVNLVELDLSNAEDLCDVSVLATDDLRNLESINLRSCGFTSAEPFRLRKQQQQQLPERRVREQQQQPQQEELHFTTLRYLNIAYGESFNDDISPLMDVSIQHFVFTSYDDKKLKKVFETISQIPELESVEWHDYAPKISSLELKKIFMKRFVSGGKDLKLLRAGLGSTPEWLGEVNELRVKNGLDTIRWVPENR